MNSLNDEMVKRPCAFVIRINSPLPTLGEMANFLVSRSIIVSTMQLQCIRDGEGVLIIHCLIEKDRIRHTVGLLEKIKGVIEMELLESKGTNIVKDFNGK